MGENGKLKRGQIGKILASKASRAVSERYPQTTYRIAWLAEFFFFANAFIFSPFSDNAEPGPRLRLSRLYLIASDVFSTRETRLTRDMCSGEHISPGNTDITVTPAKDLTSTARPAFRTASVVPCERNI